MLVFVYGTLRKGGHNHWRIETMPYVGYTTTDEPMYMVAQPSRSWPFVSRHQILPDTSPTPITGELYEIDTETLAGLDALEFRYVRIPIQTSCGKIAHMYLLEDQVLLKEIRDCGRFVPYKAGDWFGS
jgi:gamma-glutamylcyclotransferase (GGCT)/AIG2-like uncharacterized protein YtfP